jgi:triphosphoribosyl-dephospho-CoA synthase
MILLLGRKDCTRRQRDFVAGKERGNGMLLTEIANSAVNDSTAIDLAELAVWALREEALLTPKPGLVDRRGQGAHSDLTLDLLLISAQAIAPGFYAMAKRAENQTISQHLREDLGRIGRDTEKLMLSATGGINTHRGAIWALGLLVSAAAMNPADIAPKEVTDGAARLAAITDNFVSALPSHGSQAIHKFGGQSAREQAIAGFPHVVNRGLAALIASRAKGACEEDAQLNSLLTIMCDLNDTCLLYRGGAVALQIAQRGSHEVLALGGMSEPLGRLAMHDLDRDLLRHWISPGGSADLLAATIFLDRLQHHRQQRRSFALEGGEAYAGITV